MLSLVGEIGRYRNNRCNSRVSAEDGEMLWEQEWGLLDGSGGKAGWGVGGEGGGQFDSKVISRDRGESKR